jgi:signal recognition particle subunit SEC65
MQRFVLSSIKSLYKFLMVTVLVGLISFLGGLSSGIQPVYADVSTPKQALREIQKDQAVESPAKAYNEMTKIVEDPKVGIEKEYEKKEREYFKDHPDTGGLVEQAKELVTKVTDSNVK